MLAYRLLNTKANGSGRVHAVDSPRKEKLLNAKKADSTKTTTSLRTPEMLKLDNGHTNRGVTTAKDVEPKGVVKAKEEKIDPVAEAKEGLKTIDEEIKSQRKKVEAHSVVSDIAKDNMNAEAKNQRQVAKKLRDVKN